MLPRHKYPHVLSGMPTPIAGNTHIAGKQRKQEGANWATTSDTLERIYWCVQDWQRTSHAVNVTRLHAQNGSQQI
jgi:hypothetical protein